MKRPSRSSSPSSPGAFGRGSLETLEARIAPATLVGLDDSNHLLVFDSANPAAAVSHDVTGLAVGDILVGIDFRPATGALVALAKTTADGGRLYVINPATGAATFTVALTADFADLTNPYSSLDGTNFGVDFNPLVDRLRIITAGGQNLRVNLSTGGVTTDNGINPAGAIIAGAAYANSFAGTTSTTLYDIDVASDQLAIQNPPNNGTLASPVALTLAGNSVDVTGSGGFDILSTRDNAGVVTNSAFASLTTGGTTGLYQIDLGTGALTLLGSIGNGTVPLHGLTASIGSTAYAIDTNQHLVTFNTVAPTASTDLGAITGFSVNEVVIGFDFRPANGLAYVVTKNTVDASGHLYTLDLATGAVSGGIALAGTGFTTLNGTHFGVDFNPAADRLRVVSDTGQNLRVAVDSGVVVVDAALNPNAPNVFAAAYTNAFQGATSTSLYVIDAATDQLYLQNPPNNGTLVSVGGPLGVDASSVGEFDIRPNGEAYAVLSVAGVSKLYRIDLVGGSATLVGNVGLGSEVSALALAPAGLVQFLSPTYTVGEADGFTTITLSRTNGHDGPASVIVNAVSGTATAGQDFPAFSQTVTFGFGETTKTFTVPISADAFNEGPENFTLTLSQAPGDAAAVSSTPATVTITDSQALPTLSIADLRHAEGSNGVNSTFSFVVTLSAASQNNVTFSYATVEGTALAGSDFTGTSGTITILAGQTSALIPITVIGDSVAESLESFSLQLSNPSANAVIADGSAVGSIQNDDALAVTPKAIVYADADGDLAYIRIDKGNFTSANAIFEPAGNLGGLNLVRLDLTAPQFADATVKIAGVRTSLGGDGFVNVGNIDASGRTLSGIAITGDLGSVDALNLRSLAVYSMGALGTSTQSAGADLHSQIDGLLGNFYVRTDIVDASLTAGNIGIANIVGDILGGQDDHSGSIEAINRLSSITIAGSLHGGAGAHSGSLIARTVGNIRLGGLDHGHIYISGNLIIGGNTAANVANSLALGTLGVVGTVRDSEILIGFDRDGAGVNADVSTGGMFFNGNVIASDISAGVNAGGDGFFGSDTGILIANGGPVPARIASIVVKGQVLGTASNPADRFGIVAEQIGSFTVGTTPLPLTAGSSVNDTFFVGATGDVVVREYVL